MSEIKLFRLCDGLAAEIGAEAGGLERSLQAVIERNLDAMLGVRFLASEHPTGKLHGGRIDTLGLDENGCPVILEYKRAVSENVMSQGLYYLDWLLDHKAEFKFLVLDSLGKDTADDIDWSAPRLICVAADFTKHDEHAVRQINRNIDLVRYRRFGHDLLALELLTSTSASPLAVDEPAARIKTIKPSVDKPIVQALAEMDDRIRVLKKGIGVYIKVDPTTITVEQGFTRDVRNIGHWGTGDLEVWIVDKMSLKKAEPLILRSYEES